MMMMTMMTVDDRDDDDNANNDDDGESERRIRRSPQSTPLHTMLGRARNDATVISTTTEVDLDRGTDQGTANYCHQTNNTVEKLFPLVHVMVTRSA